ncbi:putative SNARE protein (Ufe1) [Aspergillus tanneri]|uniref:t-SNARE coiled-coil homology domain-containing protein n=1 Tax=Aspergillus tanneri TaxID=1220188 RepID=A0A5M9N008_9EURO|nr:uncharacterized protein ATNIH1004_003180 [Aspergillus tanneri]KAA8650493.1 hypothetical protein ATNIH1004_003180 [Aspergillus tanneri]
MTDLTVEFSRLCQEKGSVPIPPTRYLAAEKADEFLKEAHRINSHISSLLRYLYSIRPSYLSIAPSRPTTATPSRSAAAASADQKSKPLSESDRDNIDASTSLLLHDLSSSISTLSSAEALRQDTQSGLLRKRYGHGGAAGRLLWKWAGGGALSSPSSSSATSGDNSGKSEEQVRDEEVEKTSKTVRENVLWFLRRGLEDAVALQRGMVERRIERVREKEKSVLYKAAAGGGGVGSTGRSKGLSSVGGGNPLGDGDSGGSYIYEKPRSTVNEDEVKAIEAELSPEQLQLFAEENDSMVKYYEDTLSKVQNAEKSLLEISSLQQTLVSHLSTQEEYIGQLATDASNTHTNIGQGNKELKRATEQRSIAQALFWGTVGLY